MSLHSILSGSSSAPLFYTISSSNFLFQTGILVHIKHQPVCKTGCDHHKDNDLTICGIYCSSVNGCINVRCIPCNFPYYAEYAKWQLEVFWRLQLVPSSHFCVLLLLGYRKSVVKTSFSPAGSPCAFNERLT